MTQDFKPFPRNSHQTSYTWNDISSVPVMHIWEVPGLNIDQQPVK